MPVGAIIRTDEPPMQVAIRPATIEDIDLLVQLGKKTFSDTFSKDNTAEDMQLFLQETYHPDKIRAELNDKLTTYLIAYVQDSVLGFSKLRMNPCHLKKELKALEVARLYCDQPSIGKGIGACLLKKAFEIAEKSECEAVWLGVWGKNQRAIKFYEKFGFVKIGEQEFVLGKDVQTDWVMLKELK